MNREHLAHVLRAAANATGRTDLLVIGSQSILGSFDDSDLPAVATVSIEADIGVLDDDGDTVADAIDGAIGELSPFHATYGYYGQGISVTTAVLPAGWRDRLVLFETEATRPARGWCLEPHDLIIAKLVRGYPKDYAFADALGRDGVADPAILAERLAATDVADADRRRMEHWISGDATS